jgi:uncharacterized membrane protein YbhN (UPF0104 family)
MIAKWYPLLAVQAPGVGFGLATRSYLAAGFTNYFLPATVGSDALRAAVVGRRFGRVMEVGASIAAERLLGMLANGVLLMASVAVAVHLATPIGVSGAVAIAMVAAAALAVMLPFFEGARRLGARLIPARLLEGRGAMLRRFVDAYGSYRRHGSMLAGVTALSLLEVCIPIVLLALLARAFGAEVPFAALVVAVPVSMLIAKLPISVAGIGPQEASFVSLLAALGASPEAGLALAIANRGIDVLLAIPGAFLWRDLARGMVRPPASIDEAAP